MRIYWLLCGKDRNKTGYWPKQNIKLIEGENMEIKSDEIFSGKIMIFESKFAIKKKVRMKEARYVHWDEPIWWVIN